LTSLQGQAEMTRLDVVFPVLHGPYGEDGALQGLLKMADIPFVGAGVLGSAVGMDKDVMKRLLRDAGIPCAKFITARKHGGVPDYAAIVAGVGEPFFVKPANLGSSVGISKVHNRGEYVPAVTQAFSYDNKILFEEYIRGREIECSVLGNDEPIASVAGEIIPRHEFYSYDAKYIDADGAALEVPARLPEEIAAGVRRLSIAAFTVLSCAGMARVDFFLRGDSELLVNEINTIPGFTAISMYPRLWQASGVTYAELIDRLIQLAFARHEQERRLKTDY
jgi:D-alanine-D-alanine ligase